LILIAAEVAVAIVGAGGFEGTSEAITLEVSEKSDQPIALYTLYLNEYLMPLAIFEELK